VLPLNVAKALQKVAMANPKLNSIFAVSCHDSRL